MNNIIFSVSLFVGVLLSGCNSTSQRSNLDQARIVLDANQAGLEATDELLPAGTSFMSIPTALKIIMVEGRASDVPRVIRFINSSNPLEREAASRALNVLEETHKPK